MPLCAPSSSSPKGVLVLPRRRMGELDFAVTTYNRLRNKVGGNGYPHLKDGRTLFYGRERIAEYIYVLLQYKEFIFKKPNPVIIPEPPTVCNFAYLKCLAGHLNKVLPYDLVNGESDFQFWVLLTPQKDPKRVLTVLYKLACRITEEENLAQAVRGELADKPQQQESQNLLPSELFRGLQNIAKSASKLKQKQLSKEETSIQIFIKQFFLFQEVFAIMRQILHSRTKNKIIKRM